MKKAILDNKYNLIPECLKPWFSVHRDHIIPKKFTMSIPYDCHVHPYRYIPFMFYMNAQYEKYNDQIDQQIHKAHMSPEEIDRLNSTRIRLFQPLSLRSSGIPKYICLDTASIINVFMGDTGKKGRLLQKIKDNQKEVWSSFFKMDKKIFQTSNSYYFNYTIQTDGVGVSLLFKHESIKDR